MNIRRTRSFPVAALTAFLGVIVAAALVSHSFSALFIFLAATMGSIAAFVCVDRRQGDAFEPIKFASVLYATSLAVTPLLYGVDISGTPDPLTWQTQLALWDYCIFVAFLGMVSMNAGYFLPLIRLHESGYRGPNNNGRRYPSNTLITSAVAIGALGLMSYAMLVVTAGGLSTLVGYTGSRVRIFGGAFGGFYWGAFFLLSGYALYCATRLPHQLPKILFLGIILSFMYLVFQGRSLAMAPFFCTLLLYHYIVSPIRGWWLMALGVLGLVAASLLGLVRAAEKSEVYSDIGAFLSYFFENIGAFVASTTLKSIEQLDVLALSITSVQDENQLLYGASLLHWLKPIDRLVSGDTLSTVHIGNHLLQKAGPQFVGAEGALSPSLPGELYANFSILGVVIGMFLFGFFLRWLYSLIRRPSVTQVHLALFSYTSWVAALTVIDGSVSWFKAVVFALPLIAILLIAARPKHPRKSPPRTPTTPKRGYPGQFIRPKLPIASR